MTIQWRKFQGEIELRDDRIKSKWKAEIRPFLLARYSVTADFYFDMTAETSLDSASKRNHELLSFKRIIDTI